ncbi:TRAP transporter large permease [Ochrobactrum chromiisoli]|uniref:TRAP transporter large permease protein n=1 Tax=Ochrobactrum chromiisoli TaxID=2993941 RepID=A0ABT3QLJ1_9HYPH|nr:TRAP transporter large permease [Ochrobactrum chromiisoli]MCX2696480.1 TRAP transporter large permease [Ochrobactrum chromiisoli]
MITLILFGLLAVLLLFSVPIAISLGVASTLALIVSGKVSGSYVPQGLVTSIDSFPLMAVPFFILAGDLMGQGGLSQRLINVGRMLFGRYTGGMAIIAVVTCIFFAAISGSGPATVAAVGTILLPAMAKDGYKPSFSSGLISCSGSLGVIIPPSIPMVIYATSANVSVSKMFMGGVLPGLLIGFALIAYAWWQSKRDGQKPSDSHPSGREMLAALNDAKWALMVPVIILGGIYGGIFTPTEAAAVGVIYGFVVGTFVYKELSLKDLYKIFAGSGLTSASIMLIVGTATIFGRALAIEGVPVMLANTISSMVDQAWLLLLAINVILLIVGTFMETIAAIIILTPILLPLVTALGVSAEHFGIVMIVNLAIGMITPPVGVNLFVASRVSGLSLETVVKGAITPMIVMIGVLMIITYVPALSLALPVLFGM